MDNYGMRKEATKWNGMEEEIKMVDRLYHDGFTFDTIVEIVADSFEYDLDKAEVIVSEIMQAAS